MTADPGLLRLRLAVRGTAAVALAAVAEYFLAPLVGMPGIVAMLLGGTVGLQGSFAVSGSPPAAALKRLIPFPAVAGVGSLVAALLAGHKPVQLAGFAVLMVVAVFLRRWGPVGTFYGMLGWFVYFFTVFLGFGIRQWPALLLVVVVATVAVILAATVVAPERPEAVRRAARRSFLATVQALARDALDVVTGQVSGPQAAGPAQRSSLRLVEAALLIDAHLAGASQESARLVRRHLVEVELAAEQLSRTLRGLDADQRRALAPLAPALRELGRGRLEQASALLPPAHALTGAAAGGGGEHGTIDLGPVHDARDAVARVLDALTEGDTDPESGSDPGSGSATGPHAGSGSGSGTGPHAGSAAGSDSGPAAGSGVGSAPAPGPGGGSAQSGSYEPVVLLQSGNLPASVPSVNAAIDQGRLGWSLNTRLCVQTALAAPIALLAGYAISPTRYYWALLACFLCLTGALTTGEVVTKGVNRVVGTVAGLLVASVAVHLTGHHPLAIGIVMAVCVFLGLYFFRVSYAVMAFAITTVMGELYNVLATFTESLLWLRVVETAVGAAAAIVIVLIVLPVRTAVAAAAAGRAFAAALDELLAALAERLRTPARTSELYRLSRSLDLQLHQVALVSRPAAGPTLIGLAGPAAVETIGAYTRVASRARALTGAIVHTEPGSAPDCAARLDALREPGGDGQPGAGAGGHGAGADAHPAAGSGLARLIDELGAAMRRLPRSSPVG